MLSVLQDTNANIRVGLKQMRILAAVAPFAAVTGNANTLLLITRAVGSFIKVWMILSVFAAVVCF